MQPAWVPTSSFRNPVLPIPLPRALNRASYLPVNALLRSFGAIADRELDLPKRRGRHDFLRRPDGRPATVLQGFSRHLLPASTQYPPTVHTTGFWYLPAASSWTPPGDLTDFLAAGPPPVCIGFGSMAGIDPHRIGRVVTEAIRSTGQRALLISGWGGIAVDDLPPDVFLVREAPHDWLCPQTAAIVHHGGSGTTGAALASGRPQVICPFVADQPFWAARVHAAGAAPTPLPQRQLTASALAAAITTATTDPAVRRAAEQLGQRTRAEDGVAAANEVLETQI